ncbi:MAG: twin-arginine translocase subunit TatC [Devosia sp.]
MTQNNPDRSIEQPFISHLIELRDRLLKVVVCIMVVFLGLAAYANDIYSVLAGPLMKHMPANSTMIAIDVGSPFFTPFKLALVAAIFICVPVILYHFWAFIAPGLYKRERRMVLPLLIASTFLFYLGVVFAYFVVFPLVFGFLTAAAPVGVAVMTDISKYLDFVLSLFLAFGVTFEVPVAVVILVRMGLVTVATLKEIRPYVIVGAFVIGAIFTPPDVVSQVMLAVPLWILYELGIFVSQWIAKPVTEESQSGSAG